MTAGPARVSLVLLLAVSACGGHSPATVGVVAAPAAAPVVQAPNTLTPAEAQEGWTLLFDGRSTAGWRGWRLDSMPPGWQVVDGALARVSPASDIVTVGEYRNFDLRLDWNVPPGGNSGIFYRADEKSTYIFQGAPEMQVLDDTLQTDGASLLTAAGSVSGLYPTRKGVVHSAGTWNHAEIIVKGRHVEQWLNGVRVVAYVLESPDWVERVHHSKFEQWPDYGRALTGHIGLQDGGTGVQYANVKIRVLP